MTTRRISKEKREMLRWLELMLREYPHLLGIHYEKERLDRDIEYAVETLKKMY